MTEKLRLEAVDAEDLAIVSACLQDARVTLREMAFMPTERRFMAAFTRYRRERQQDPASCEGLTEQVAVLTFEAVPEVRYRGIDPAEPLRELVLLTIATSPGREHLIHIELVFEGDAGVQLRTEAIHCKLADFGDPVLCVRTPCDHFAQATYAQMADDADPA